MVKMYFVLFTWELFVFQCLMMDPREIWWAWQEPSQWATEVMNVSLKEMFLIKQLLYYALACADKDFDP